MDQKTLLRNQNGRPQPIGESQPRVSPKQRSLPLHAPKPDPLPEPEPKPETVYDMATQAREMANLVTAFARAYGHHIPPKVAMEIARLITKEEHRYAFGEFDETNADADADQ